MPGELKNSVPLELGCPWILIPPDPAAGADYVMTHPHIVNRRFFVEGMRFSFTTDANVANRYINLTWGELFGDFPHYTLNQIQTAGAPLVYNLRAEPYSAVYTVALNVFGTMPMNIQLDSNFMQLNIRPIDMQVGDQLSDIAIWGRSWAQRTE